MKKRLKVGNFCRSRGRKAVIMGDMWPSLRYVLFLKLAGFFALAPLDARAFGRAAFDCDGGEYSKNWFGKETFLRELRFELTALSADGKKYTVRFLGRALTGTFSGKNIGNESEKFVLFQDQINKVHRLTYEPSEGKLIKANCQITEYR